MQGDKEKARLGLLRDAKIGPTPQASNPVRAGKVKRCRVGEGERKDRQSRSEALTRKTGSCWISN